MAKDQREAKETDEALAEVFEAYRSVQPQNTNEQTFLQNSLDRLDDVTQARRERIASSSKALPAPMWMVLLFGAAITLGFTLFLPVQNPPSAGLDGVVIGGHGSAHAVPHPLTRPAVQR